MSRLLKFNYDGSLWRFDKKATEWPWRQVHSKVIEKYSRFDGWAYRVTKRGEPTYHDHLYSIVRLGESKLEIDAVLWKMGGPGRITAATIVHLDGEMVGLTRATGGSYGGGVSGFTYVEFNDSLIGISHPNRTDSVSRMGLPTIEIWHRTTEEQAGRSPELGEIEDKRIPGKDGSWQEEMKRKVSWASEDQILVSDGTLMPGWHGNPREIRLLELTPNS